jgi:hypothetical protein
MKAITRIVPAAFFLLTLRCGSGATDTSSNGSLDKVSVATAAAGDLTVELLTDKALQTGLTPVYLRIAKASGQAVTDASVTFLPTMSMSGVVEHGAPLIGQPTIAPDGLYHGQVVFLMPSTSTGTWAATVDITQSGSTTAVVTFPTLNVSVGAGVGVFSRTDPISTVTTRYVASLNFVTSPAVGLNPIIVTLHQTPDMLTFLPVDDATVVLDPQMPVMGHGSPGSVNPTLLATGLYQGNLSFSMAGTWQTTVTISEGTTVLGAPIFETTF